MSSSLAFSDHWLPVCSGSNTVCLLVPLLVRQSSVSYNKFPSPWHTSSHKDLILTTRYCKSPPIKIKVYDMKERVSVDVDANISCSREYGNEDGIVIVDHGSRRAQSNSMLYTFVEMFKQKTGHANVEPAHMELASPTIKEAFDKCVRQGASRVVISPYFLFPGRHWDKDIPELAAEAAKLHPTTSYIVTGPIGLHELMVNILQERINHCLSQVAGKVSECEMCAGTGRCKFLKSSHISQANGSSCLEKEI